MGPARCGMLWPSGAKGYMLALALGRVRWRSAMLVVLLLAGCVGKDSEPVRPSVSASSPSASSPESSTGTSNATISEGPAALECGFRLGHLAALGTAHEYLAGTPLDLIPVRASILPFHVQIQLFEPAAGTFVAKIY